MRVSLVFASAFLSRLLSALFASSLCRRKDTHWLGFRVFEKEKRKIGKKGKASKETVIIDGSLQALYDDDAFASSSTLDDFDDAIVVVGLEKVVVVVYVVVSIPVGKRRSRLSRFEALLL